MVDSRTLWRCRRGIREVEELLLAFAQARYTGLTEEEQGAFHRLLDYPDPVLLAYTLGEAIPRDRTLALLIEAIRTPGA